MSERIEFRVNEEDYIFLQQLKEECVKKHTSYYSHWGRKICALARLGLKHTTSNTHTPRKTKRAYNSYQQLLFSMQNYKQVRNPELAEIIDNACGRGARDLRTFKNNKQFLLEDDIIVLNTSIPSQPGKQIYDINQKKLLFKIRNFSSTINDKKYTSKPKVETIIENPQTQKQSNKAEIDKILAEAGAVVQ